MPNYYLIQYFLACNKFVSVLQSSFFFLLFFKESKDTQLSHRLLQYFQAYLLTDQYTPIRSMQYVLPCNKYVIVPPPFFFFFSFLFSWERGERWTAFNLIAAIFPDLPAGQIDTPRSDRYRLLLFSHPSAGVFILANIVLQAQEVRRLGRFTSRCAISQEKVT